MPIHKNEGYCVYNFAHHGFGKIISNAKDWKKRQQQLISGQPHNDITHVFCGPDKNIILKKYKDAMEKKKLNRASSRRRGSSTKRKSPAAKRQGTKRKSPVTKRQGTKRKSPVTKRQGTKRKSPVTKRQGTKRQGTKRKSPMKR